MAAKVAEPSNNKANRPSARAAVPPAAAVPAAEATPTTSNENTRGTMVMRNASSHMPPTGSATARIRAMSGCPAMAAPMHSPATRLNTIRKVGCAPTKRNAVGSLAITRT